MEGRRDGGTEGLRDGETERWGEGETEGWRDEEMKGRMFESHTHFNQQHNITSIITNT
jgi:hypothetical protein